MKERPKKELFFIIVAFCKFTSTLLCNQDKKNMRQIMVLYCFEQ